MPFREWALLGWRVGWDRSAPLPVPRFWFLHSAAVRLELASLPRDKSPPQLLTLSRTPN